MRYAFIATMLAAAMLATTIVGSHPSNAAPPSDGAGSPLAVATPDPEWDQAFTHQDGWTGADVAGTIDLEDGRILWTFGDTWIGRVVDHAHKDARLVNNSLAIQPAPTGPAGRPPQRDQLRFFWGSDFDRRPRAWLTPASATTAADKQQEKPTAAPTGERTAAGNEAATAGGQQYWFTGGGVVSPGPQKQPRLALFLFDVAKRPNDHGVWGFDVQGSLLATVDDFAGDPSGWSVAAHPIPFAVGATAARRDPGRYETFWGMAALRAERPASQAAPAGETLYIYGVRSHSTLDRRLLLARVPAEKLTEFDAWTFYAGAGRWSSLSTDAAPVATNVPTELSVERMHVAGSPRWLMIHSEPPLGARVLLRVASAPEGPWSTPTPLFTAPEPARDRRYFAYAAKGHAPLSAPGELLVSYVVNSHDFNAMFHDATIYRPRFFRASVSAARLDALLAEALGAVRDGDRAKEPSGER